jgi:hypothetical protein
MVSFLVPATAVVYISLAFDASSLDISTSLSRSTDQWQLPTGSLGMLAHLMPKSALLPPGSSHELKYVLLGVGTQNYTCSSEDKTIAPGTTGTVGG